MLRHWLQSSQSFFHSQALKQNDEMKKKWLEICERDWKSRRSAKIINAKEVVKKTGAKKRVSKEKNQKIKLLSKFMKNESFIISWTKKVLTKRKLENWTHKIHLHK